MAYTWDANKNKLSEVLTGVNATVNGYGFNAVDTTYDFEDRLTQWKRANGAQNQSWSLTAVGDWQSQTVNGTATSRTHGPTHELTAIGASSLAYDAKGNLTQDTSRSPTQNYAWDYDNKMKSADIDGNGSADVSFEYDALGRRVARTQGANAVVYFQVDQQTICDYPRGGAAASPTYRYIWGSYIDELIARKATGTSGAVLFAHRNQQYSIYAYSNSSGAVVERIAFTAYGQPTFMNAAGTVQSTSPNSIRYSYTGREWDASLQLHHFRTRWMGPVTGRFLGRDPIGYGDGPNCQQYAKHNPVRIIDPTGEITVVNARPPNVQVKACQGPTAFYSTEVTLTLDNPNSCSGDGYIIQRFCIWCSISNCPCNAPKLALANKNPSACYFEAFRVPKGSSIPQVPLPDGTIGSNDTFEVRSGEKNRCGYRYAEGESYFYCADTEVGGTTVGDIISSWKPFERKVDNCRGTRRSGVLPAKGTTRDQNPFPTLTPIETGGKHSLGVQFACCECNEKEKVVHSP